VLSLTATEMCDKLGYARNTHHGWADTGNMPYVAAKAIEAWVSIKTSQYKEQCSAVIIIRPASKDELSLTPGLLQRMNIPHSVL
jgi:predicted site-specific integrase-resolvase